MKIAIVDDEIIICTQLEKILISIFKNAVLNIDLYHDGKDFIEEMNNGAIYDVVFLDLEMNIYNGYITGELIRENDTYENIYIILISGHTENLGEYFKLHPFDFIGKPFVQNDIKVIMEKVIKDINFRKQRIMITFKNHQVNIPISDITYIESYKRTAVIHLTGGRTQITYKKLDELLDILNSITDTFYKINKSYVINWQYVNKITSSRISIDDVTLTIGSNYKHNLLISRINTLTKE